MKVNVVKDSRGNVTATYEAVGTGSIIVPKLKPGHTVHEVDVPNDYKNDLVAFYRHHSR